MSEGQSRAFTYNIVDHLVQYSATHFAHEERLMRAKEYPGMAAHKAEHGALTAKVVQFRVDFEAGRADISAELLQSVESLLAGHFRGLDRKLSIFLRQETAA